MLTRCRSETAGENQKFSLQRYFFKKGNSAQFCEQIPAPGSLCNSAPESCNTDRLPNFRFHVWVICDVGISLKASQFGCITLHACSVTRKTFPRWDNENETLATMKSLVCWIGLICLQTFSVSFGCCTAVLDEVVFNCCPPAVRLQDVCTSLFVTLHWLLIVQFCGVIVAKFRW